MDVKGITCDGNSKRSVVILNFRMSQGSVVANTIEVR